MAIGDSLTSSGDYTRALLRSVNPPWVNASSNPGLKIAMVGSDCNEKGNCHEGRGGWQVSDYATAGRPGVAFNVSGVNMSGSWATNGLHTTGTWPLVEAGYTIGASVTGTGCSATCPDAKNGVRVCS